MSQTKYKLEKDVKEMCLSIVRGYRRRVKLYHQRRDDIIYASPCRYETYLAMIDGKPTACRAYNAHVEARINKPVESTHAKLLAIESLYDTKCMRAVEQAICVVGADIVSDSDREMLKTAIMSSCVKGRDFRFAYWALPMSKDNFYERRRKFLYNIATYMAHM